MTNDQARVLTLETAIFIINPATNLPIPAIIKGVNEDAEGNISITAVHVTPVSVILTSNEVELTAPVINTTEVSTEVVNDAFPSNNA